MTRDAYTWISNTSTPFIWTYGIRSLYQTRPRCHASFAWDFILVLSMKFMHSQVSSFFSRGYFEKQLYMKLSRHTRMRSSSSLCRTPLPIPPPGPLLPQNVSVDEEICPGYDSKKFYPASAGEVLANRYQILVKVGWGVSSTVWLARDMRGYCCLHCTYALSFLRC